MLVEQVFYLGPQFLDAGASATPKPRPYPESQPLPVRAGANLPYPRRLVPPRALLPGETPYAGQQCQSFNDVSIRHADCDRPATTAIFGCPASFALQDSRNPGRIDFRDLPRLRKCQRPACAAHLAFLGLAVSARTQVVPSALRPVPCVPASLFRIGIWHMAMISYASRQRQ
jgi:hypothetical protein